MASNSLTSQIAGLQTVMPAKVTEHRQIRRIFSTLDPTPAGIFQRSLNIVLYYNKHGHNEDDENNVGSGWIVAGWIKESLGRAMSEEPLVSGRLREGREGLEVVANDSGVRLVEAKIPVSLRGFLDMVGRDEKVESEVVFWKDIDEQDHQFSPLFYVQVTNFLCGGYSIGISCSLLLADILLEADFLRKWAEIHNNLLLKTDDTPTKTPIFYLPKLKQDCDYLSGLTTSISVQARGNPTFFNANTELDSCKILGSVCMKEAEIKLGGKSGSSFFLLVKEARGDVKVETCTHEVENREIQVVVGWDELGLNEVGFWQGTKPVQSSCWVGSVSDGLVFVVPRGVTDDHQGKPLVRVIVAIP